LGCPCVVSGKVKASLVEGAKDRQDWILAAAEAVNRVDGVEGQELVEEMSADGAGGPSQNLVRLESSVLMGTERESYHSMSFIFRSMSIGDSIHVPVLLKL
jgi:hypothetical protein